MQGKPIIIAELNKLLAGELTAIDQYFIHSRMYQDWGYSKLFERISHESEEEKQHASWIIERILFLEGIPEMSLREPLHIGKTVPEMLQNDLELQLRVERMEGRQEQTDDAFGELFEAVKQLMEGPSGDRLRIGYKGGDPI